MVPGKALNSNSLSLFAQNAAAVKYMSFKGEAAVNCSEYAYEGFSDVDLYRQFRFLSKQGPGALEQEDLTEVSSLVSQ